MRSRSQSLSRTGRRLSVAAAATILALGAGALTTPAAHAAPIVVQILATNDFHGRILNNTTNGEAGAAVLAGAVTQLRAENPNTVFAAAGDLIGASTFESFIQSDKPTIDALNGAGLDVSAVGNHELDQGYADLVERVMAPYDPTTNPYGGAEWEYIAANLRVRSTGEPAVPPTWIQEFGDVSVGFVGAVTEELRALVSPGGIADIDVLPIIESVNTEAAALVAGGADLVVMLVHEGAPTTDCATMDDTGPWADIVNNVSADVDAIVSGHTHLAYDCSFPVAQWASEGRAVTDRPVVSAGQYGTNLNQLQFTVDGATGAVSAVSQALLKLEDPVESPRYPADTAVAGIVSRAATEADALGAVELGTIGGPFNRAQVLNAEGARIENRGGESTLGNLVAEVQQWATEAPESGASQIAFMNPGGLRADMTGVDPGDGSYPRVVTVRQAAAVQSFANTLVNLQLTGAQIKSVLEQQWQRDAFNKLPTRPFLRLGVSEGFEYTYTQQTVSEQELDNPTTPEDESLRAPYSAPQGTVTGMWLHGEPIDLTASYSVTVNSFLSTGGDNFREFANGTGKRDTGKVDLAAMVDYMGAFAASTPLPVDYAQHAVEVAFPQDAPTAYELGSTVAFDVRSWSMTHATDVRDSELIVSLADRVLGTFPVDSTLGTAPYDDYGTASVAVELPADAPVGAIALTLTGAATGTSIEVALTTVDRAGSITIGIPNKLYAKQNAAIQYRVLVLAEGATPVTGEVTIRDGSEVIATATLTAEDHGTVKVTLPALGRGVHALSASYAGSDTVKPSTSGTVPVIIR
ncbi:5'-nucleotidase C-terminal domain-containing protein [Microbacterium sp. zg.B48]|uniref:5'-nucleotidase C-terminal domain-containing protein n=1 Tax=Microbacterium sp. zg.B48 TaxID=2969408 RepID=UPI00214AA0C1|nr:5'-nucleotidase C-terminal domain-containing protein [Microbacterium sp. zg.B48]MCR2762164.1 5'-nucleotidase C-terminal domain-containing protein [Microbacterium sp. zg.B48]